MINIEEAVNEFKTSKREKGEYSIFAKDVINDSVCSGIYFIHESKVLMKKYKKITNAKKSININFIGLVYIY